MNPIIRFSPDASGELFYDPASGLRCGVEVRKGSTVSSARTTGNSLFVVLSGQATITARGEQHVLSGGEAITLPWQTDYEWAQEGDTVAYYAIQSEPAVIAGDTDRISVIRPGAIGELAYCAPPPQELLVGPMPTQFVKQAFLDATRQWSTGYWDSTEYYRVTRPFTKHEFMLVLTGTLSLTRPGEPAEVFQAGEALLLPKGTVCDWETPGMSKIYCSFVERPAGSQQSAAEGDRGVAP